jgi:hypothetical protein
LRDAAAGKSDSSARRGSLKPGDPTEQTDKRGLSVYKSTGHDHRFLMSYPASLFLEVWIKGAM